MCVYSRLINAHRLYLLVRFYTHPVNVFVLIYTHHIMVVFTLNYIYCVCSLLINVHYVGVSDLYTSCIVCSCACFRCPCNVYVYQVCMGF